MDKAENTDISQAQPRGKSVLYLSMFVMGGCGLAYEYTLSKVSSDLMGNSVQQWAIIIGVMMFFMGVGSDLQKHLSDKGLVDKFLLGEILLGLIGGFGPIAMLWSHGSPYAAMVQYFFICIIGLLIGLEIPLLTRINESYSKSLSFNLGAILKMDYIGALAGALLWIFVLTRNFSIVQTAFILGMLNVLTAAFGLNYFRRLTLHPRALAILCLSVLSLLGYGYHCSNDWSSNAEQALYRDRIVFKKTTPFQHIVITQSKAGDFACYINRHLQFHSFDEHIYHECLVHPAMQLAARRKNVLVLGGGDGLAVREILKYADVEQVTLVDIDPEMTELARNNPLFAKLNNHSLSDARVTTQASPAISRGDAIDLEIKSKLSVRAQFGQVAQVNVINIDAMNFMENAAGIYDVIIIDFPDPNAQELSKLYSREFYNLVRSHLASDGLLIQQSTSPIHAKQAYLCIGRTMDAAGLSSLPLHENVPSFGEWGWWIAGRDEHWDAKRLRSELKRHAASEHWKTPVETRYLTPELMGTMSVFGRGILETKETGITTLTRPQVFQYYETDEGWRLE